MWLPGERTNTRAVGTAREYLGETVGVKSAHVLADWHWLHETRQLSEADSLNHRIELAAPRIGMSCDALEQALRRAGIRNPVEPAMTLRYRKSLCLGCKNADHTADLARANVHRVARMLARRPDSPRYRAALEAAQAELAEAEAHQAWHAVTEHEGDAA